MIRIICLIIGYAFGLIQTSYIIGKIHGIDIRQHGSGNAGTTNMIRTLGTKWGLLTFAGDFLKSFLAVTLVGLIFRNSHADILPILKLYTGAGAVIAHDFPFYLDFKGGKGVAASAGMVTAFEPVIFLIALASFLAIAIITKYVSAGSLTCYAVFFLLVLVYGMIGRFHMTSGHLIELYLIAFFLTALCWWQHRENIRRLAAGTERKTHLFHRESDKE